MDLDPYLVSSVKTMFKLEMLLSKIRRASSLSLLFFYSFNMFREFFVLWLQKMKCKSFSVYLFHSNSGFHRGDPRRQSHIFAGQVWWTIGAWFSGDFSWECYSSLVLYKPISLFCLSNFEKSSINYNLSQSCNAMDRLIDFISAGTTWYSKTL